MTESPNTEIIDSPESEPMLRFPLDPHGQKVMDRLALWSKVVGIIYIITGVVYFLNLFGFSNSGGGVPLLMIPIILAGVFIVFLGSRLTSSAAYLRYAVYHRDSESFVNALDQLRLFLILHGIMLLSMIVIMIFFALLIAFLGEAFEDYFFMTDSKIVVRSWILRTFSFH